MLEKQLVYICKIWFKTMATILQITSNSGGNTTCNPLSIKLFRTVKKARTKMAGTNQAIMEKTLEIIKHIMAKAIITINSMEMAAVIKTTVTINMETVVNLIPIMEIMVNTHNSMECMDITEANMILKEDSTNIKIGMVKEINRIIMIMGITEICISKEIVGSILTKVMEKMEIIGVAIKAITIILEEVMLIQFHTTLSKIKEDIMVTKDIINQEEKTTII